MIDKPGVYEDGLVKANDSFRPQRMLETILDIEKSVH